MTAEDQQRIERLSRVEVLLQFLAADETEDSVQGREFLEHAEAVRDAVAAYQRVTQERDEAPVEPCQLRGWGIHTYRNHERCECGEHPWEPPIRDDAIRENTRRWFAEHFPKQEQP